jgi:hypothetical protein
MFEGDDGASSIQKNEFRTNNDDDFDFGGQQKRSP